MPAILAFDMNGTLLDTAALDPLFSDAFGRSDVRQQWFQQMIEMSMVATITGWYTNFSKLGRAALEAVAQKHGKDLPEDQLSGIIQKVRSLPAFPDVKPALHKLKDAEVRLAVLTNSPSSSAEESLSAAGIRGYFEQVLSVDMVQCFKPAAQVYRTAASRLGVSRAEMMLVAAHSWDTTGAIRAGCQAAFIRRPGEVLSSVDERPSIVINDMYELAGKILSNQAA